MFGLTASVPNQAALINTLALQEAEDSSAIENIVITRDELSAVHSLPQNTPTCSRPPLPRKYAIACRPCRSATAWCSRPACSPPPTCWPSRPSWNRTTRAFSNCRASR
ncbi:MAG: hypothetical protein H7337_08455 [Rhizobacter sp.]|nr:hypothetical protein [Rhizobacter sp.]